MFLRVFLVQEFLSQMSAAICWIWKLRCANWWVLSVVFESVVSSLILFSADMRSLKSLYNSSWSEILCSFLVCSSVAWRRSHDRFSNSDSFSFSICSLFVCWNVSLKFLIDLEMSDQILLASSCVCFLASCRWFFVLRVMEIGESEESSSSVSFVVSNP